jgi:hypothetical protein
MKRQLGIAVFIISIVAILCYMKTTEPEITPQQTATEEAAVIARANTKQLIGNGTRAAIECKDVARMRLQSPASAKFPWDAEGRALGKYRYLTDSYVDAQNGFGAVLRKEYICIMRDDPTHGWTLEHFRWL